MILENSIGYNDDFGDSNKIDDLSPKKSMNNNDNTQIQKKSLSFSLE